MATAPIQADELKIFGLDVRCRDDRARGFALSSLRGRPVERGGRELGALVDVVVGHDGSVVEVVIQSAEGRVSVPLDTNVRFTPGSRSAA